jgi:hypothetical protein
MLIVITESMHTRPMPIYRPTSRANSSLVQESQSLWNMFSIFHRSSNSCRSIWMNTTSTYKNLYLWARTITSRVHMRLAQSAKLILALKYLSRLIFLDEMLQRGSSSNFRFVDRRKTRIYFAISVPVTDSVETGVNEANIRLRRWKTYTSSSHILVVIFTGARRKGGMED